MTTNKDREEWESFVPKGGSFQFASEDDVRKFQVFLAEIESEHKKEITQTEERVIERVVREIEMLTNRHTDNQPTRSIDNRTILERRWTAYKLILHGITDKNHKQSLEVVGVLMDKKNEKDGWLIEELVKRIMIYEDIKYPTNSITKEEE